MTTIEEIEGDRWPTPDPAATPLVYRCSALRRKPLHQFAVEDLRILLGQQIAVPILLPRAVAALLADPMAEGDCYPGDLLHAVVRLPADSWKTLTNERERLIQRLVPLLDPDKPQLPAELQS